MWGWSWPQMVGLWPHRCRRCNRPCRTYTDTAGVACSLSSAPYRKRLETVWGADSFAIQWPRDAERICATPGPPPANDQLPLHLSPGDRAPSDHVYDEFGLAISAYEFSPEVSPVTSKYDYVQAAKHQFTPHEKLDYPLL